MKAIGGSETHVHLIFQMEPFVNLSEIIGKLKGSSSIEMNTLHGKNSLKWQRGYGIVSFDTKNLSSVRQYVENQKEHHSKGTVKKLLEEFTRFE